MNQKFLKLEMSNKFNSTTFTAEKEALELHVTQEKNFI